VIRYQTALSQDLTWAVDVMSEGVQMAPLLNALRVILSNAHNIYFSRAVPHPAFHGMFTPRSWRVTVALLIALERGPAVQWASHAWSDDPDFTTAVAHAVERLRFPAGPAPPPPRPDLPPHAPAFSQPFPNPSDSAPAQTPADPRLDMLMAAVQSLTNKVNTQTQTPTPLTTPTQAPQPFGVPTKGTLPEAPWSVGLPLPPGAWRRPAIWVAGWRDASTLRRLGAQMENGRDRAATAAAVRSLTSLSAALLHMEQMSSPSTVFDDTFLRTWLPLWAFTMAEQTRQQYSGSNTSLLPGFCARAAEVLEASGGAITESQAMASLDQVAKRYKAPRGRSGRTQRPSDRRSRAPSATPSRGRSASSHRGNSSGGSRASTSRGRSPGGRRTRSAGGSGNGGSPSAASR
jgi:hypothetical protein